LFFFFFFFFSLEQAGAALAVGHIRRHLSFHTQPPNDRPHAEEALAVAHIFGHPIFHIQTLSPVEEAHKHMRICKVTYKYIGCILKTSHLGFRV
jgi:hypothetical protein